MNASTAQPAPGPKQAGDALGTIGQYGAVGAICVLAIIALYLSIRGWLNEKDGRLTDQKAMASSREKDNDALKTLTVEMKEFAAEQKVEATRSNDAMTNALVNQKEEMSEMKAAFTSLQQEQVRLANTVQQGTR